MLKSNPCAYGDRFEKASDNWWSAPEFGYGEIEGLTFYSLVTFDGNDHDWFRYLPIWTGNHWFWTQNVTGGAITHLDLYELRMDDFTLRWLGSGFGPSVSFWLEAGKVYYVAVNNVAPGHPIGCYELVLDP